MSSEPREYLRHILVEADYLISQRTGLTFEDFAANQTLRREVVRSLEIIGEAAKKVPPEFLTTISAWTTSLSGTSFRTAFRSFALKSYRYLRHSGRRDDERRESAGLWLHRGDGPRGYLQSLLELSPCVPQLGSTIEDEPLGLR
jgi:hypothetical protein